MFTRRTALIALILAPAWVAQASAQDAKPAATTTVTLTIEGMT